MVTDPAELARLAHAMEAENLEFRRHLKAHHGDHELLHSIGAEIEAAIDCTKCAACCRETRVEVGPEDVQRVAAFLHIRPAEAQRMYTERASGGALLIAHRQGECVFLDHSQCLIYEARPPACRLFPYLAAPESSLGSRMESICRRAWFCPIVFNTLEEYKRRSGFHPRAQR